MTEHAQAANQAREMQSRTAKPAGKDEVKKDGDGNIIGANIGTDGRPFPQVRDQDPPGLGESHLVGGVGIYGSGQDQDGEEVQSKGEEENEERKKRADEVEKKAEEQEQQAQKANADAMEEAKKPRSEREKAKGSKSKDK